MKWVRNKLREKRHHEREKKIHDEEKKYEFDNFFIDPIFDLVKLAFNNQHRVDAKCPSEISDVFIHSGPLSHKNIFTHSLSQIN